MKKIHKQLEEQGVEIINDGSTIAYFYDDVLIALKRDRDLSIFRTFEQKISDLYNIMLKGTVFEHYINNGVNKISTMDEKGKVHYRRMSEDFTWRVE